MKYRILQKGTAFKIQIHTKRWFRKPYWANLKKTYPPDSFEQTVILYSLEDAKKEVEQYRQSLIIEKKGWEVIET